jgi:putative transposase
MPCDPNKHHRRSIRLPGYDYAQEGAYFVTIVTAQRQCLFGDVVEVAVRLSPLGMVAAACWQAIPQHFPGVEIDVWVIMPNHVHGIIVLPGSAAVDGGSVAHTSASVSVGAQRVRANRVGAPVGAQHAAPLPPIAPGPAIATPPVVPTPDVPRVAPGSLGAIVRSFKSAVTKQAREMAWMPDVPLWQRNYYEHIVRNERQLERLRRYIDENPGRWQLDHENPARTRAKAKR